MLIDDPPRRTPMWRALKEKGFTSASDVLRALGVKGAPVDVVLVAQALGIPINVVKQPGWTGAMKNDGKAASIWVKAEDDVTRQRFTIAHEIGHVMLHPAGVLFRDNASYSGDEREKAANDFAAQLLMPMPLMDAIAMQTNRDVHAIARAFQVSPGAARIRLREWEEL